jgi:hypothetical protein
MIDAALTKPLESTRSLFIFLRCAHSIIAAKVPEIALHTPLWFTRDNN